MLRRYGIHAAALLLFVLCYADRHHREATTPVCVMGWPLWFVEAKRALWYSRCAVVVSFCLLLAIGVPGTWLGWTRVLRRFLALVGSVVGAYALLLVVVIFLAQCHRGSPARPLTLQAGSR